ncbi:MAG: 7-cyano-7-deazaguanine synthase QueC [Nitrospirae bacterium]|nr:7-cyano-7-deazaguanine synthase QueC [Nitrospirota bacterium]
MMKKAVVLLSGGVDSTTVMAIAKAQGGEIYALSFDYGQRHKIELELARLNAEKFGAKKHLTINIDLRDIGGSALTSEMEVPKAGQKSEVRSQKLGNSKLIPVTYVPARNTIFLSFALGWAEVLEAEDIFIGANAIDYSGYPDCRPEFIKAFEDMANLATKASVEGKCRFKIQAPLIKLTKGEIIKKGIELGVDYALTWSCYDPQEDRNALSVMSNELKTNTHHASRITHHGYVPCLSCDSCLLRAKGFKEAGAEDPLLIDKKPI